MTHDIIICGSSVTDIYYILRKSKGRQSTIEFLKELFNHILILGVDREIVMNALNSKIKDFEDAIQVETSRDNNIEKIITRIEKDFVDSGLEILSPKDFI